MGAGWGFGTPKYEHVTMRTLLPTLEGMIDVSMEAGFSNRVFNFTNLFIVVLYNFEPLE